jgi:hypothetical protein
MLFLILKNIFSKISMGDNSSKPCLTFVFTLFFYRLAYNIKVLQTNRNSLQQVETTLDGCINWMIVLENSFERLVNETNKPEVRANDDLCKIFLDQFKVG